MRAVIVTQPDKLEVVQVAKPRVGPYQALVKTELAALCNSTDSKLISGHFPGAQEFPMVLGHEDAGIVEAIGAKVRNFKPGDRAVGGLVFDFAEPGLHGGFGGFCDYTVVNDHEAMIADGVADAAHGWRECYEIQRKVDADIPLEEAVLLCMWREVYGGFGDFRLQAGERVLVFGAFDPPYRGAPLESFSFGVAGIAGRLKQGSLQFTLEVDVELSDQTVRAVAKQITEMRKGDVEEGGAGPRYHIKERLLRYRITVEVLPQSGILRVADEFLAAIKENGELKSSRNPFLEKKGDRLHLRLEGQAHPTYHEVGLDHAIVSRPLYPPHYPHIAAFRQELAGWLCFYFEPRAQMRAPNPVKEVRHIGLMGENLAAFFNTLKATAPSHFEAVEKSIWTLIPRIQGLEVEPNQLGEVELRIKEDGIPVSARLISEGTQRLLGLLAVGVSGDAPTVVALEEPENGIHPRRIQLIARYLETKASEKDTQFIGTIHSPLLPDMLPSECLFVVRRREEHTRIEPFAETGPLFRSDEINERLQEPGEGGAKISERILRGDFDA